METKTKEMLPKTSLGTVHVQFVRCGKPNCKCSRGDLHGAYYYHFVRINGRLRKRYLRSADLASFQVALLARRAEQKLFREKTKGNWEILRRIRESAREFHNTSSSRNRR